MPAVVEMELLGVRLEVPGNNPVILLRETSGRHRILPIYIAGPEAQAIAYALEGIKPPRPLTHDLFKDVLDQLGATLVRIVVTELRDHTFFAELVIDQQGSEQRVSSRPSDSVALAVRTGSPIFAEEAVLAEAGQEPEAEDEAGETEEELVDEFRSFIDQVNPEDFA